MGIIAVVCAFLAWASVLLVVLTLYLAAMGIPLIGAAVWASMPGNIAAPFDWRMALPGVADILTGIVFYFAGILTEFLPNHRGHDASSGPCKKKLRSPRSPR